MSVIKLEKWYMEGAPPVWHVLCSSCKREFHILESQAFRCPGCLRNMINMEEFVPQVEPTATVTG